MNNLVKIQFKRSTLVSEIQCKLNELEKYEQRYNMKCIYSRDEIDRNEDIPLYVKYYVKKNYMNKLAILHLCEIAKLFAVPSVAKLINYDKDLDPDEDTKSYGEKILKKLLRFNGINKYYRVKIKGTLDLGKYDKTFKYLITEFFTYVKTEWQDSIHEMYIFNLNEEGDLVIPDFGSENLKIDVLRDDVLDTPETRQMFLNRI